METRMTKLQFWYDFSSPWTYLAATQIEVVAERAGAELAWRPFLLGALFKQIGTHDVPLLQMSEAKRRYAARDLHYWASHWGVPFQFATRFPMRTVTALRLALLAGDKIAPVSRDLFRALWVDDRDLNDEAVLSEILDAHGLDPKATLARTQDPEIKQQLIANTTEAVERGVFGAPTFIVEQAEGDLLFWGQDRLDFVERALGGWRPPHG
jgi:2-hydroxychromene-2-carboxylate isomerase